MYIIAEIGVNHDGILNKAFKLIDAAKECKCDAVKFQSFKAERLVHLSAKKVQYQLRSGDKKESHYEMIRKLEFNDDKFVKAFNYANKIGIDFITTPYDPLSAKEAYEYGVRKFKTASADLSDFYLHKVISSLKDIEIFIATGMSKIENIKNTISLYKNLKPIILHCVSGYPCKDESINIRSFEVLKEIFPEFKLGFSDHSIDEIASIIANTIGYTVFERHFTLDKNDEGPDHYASSNVEEMKSYVKNLRRVPKILGEAKKETQEEEVGMSRRSKKAILTKTKVEKGEILSLDNTYALRPAENGISIDNLNKILGKKFKTDLEKDVFIKSSDLI
tara:strand:+ start:452 stop:1453 length:1002 start_codon:yes stop_codon:yes gene_type:complete